MSVSERVVYGRSFRVTPVWLWIAQRLSAVLIGPLVLLHVWGVAWSRHPLVLGLLLVIIVAHGYSGLRRIAPKERTAGPSNLIAIVWAAAVLFFGCLTVASFMGAAG